MASLAPLTAGVDMWHLHPLDALGLRSIKVTDGPAGARGARWFGESSLCVPCGTALGATWSPDVVGEVATLLATETRRKGADMLLAPTVNLHRHPLAGRNFECYSEDPELTAQLASSYIRALQGDGVSACVKHFVANDQETDRHDISAVVPEVALRELYLRPFEVAVREAGTWAVMSAYNRLEGVHCSQNRWLLSDLLRSEWGFDGVVVSDWWGTHAADALVAGLDVEMPGPALHLGDAVTEAIDAGEIERASLDRAVERLMNLAERIGALGEPGSTPPGPPAEESPSGGGDGRERAVLQRAAVESIVLLRNDLPEGDGSSPTPLVPFSRVGSVAVLGPNAADTAVMGGGSAAFVAARMTDVLSALRDRIGADTEIIHRRGVPLPEALRALDRRWCRTTAEPGSPGGFTIEHFDSAQPSGEPELVETSLTSRLLWTGSQAPGLAEQDTSIRMRTWLTPRRSGPHTFSLVTGATGTVHLDGEVILDNTDHREPGTDFFGLASAEIRTTVELTAGESVEIEAVTTPLVGVPVGGMAIGHAEPDDSGESDPLAAAVEAARNADFAVVVVGGDDQYETEGMDRASMALPPGQPELVEAVCEANPNTIVVLNVGSPVDVSCATGAPALLQAWYPGQEAGAAIVDVLTGARDPGGRLPTTLGHEPAQWRSDENFPGVDGEVSYEEGLFVGYRDFDAAGKDPAFRFGHGLSTTTFGWSEPAIEPGFVAAGAFGEGSPPRVTTKLVVTNTGDRPGTEVVQCYLSPTAGDVVDAARPPQHLAGFAKVHLDPGESTTVAVPIGWAAVRRWKPGTGWTVPTGIWEVRLSASSRDHRALLSLEVGP